MNVIHIDSDDENQSILTSEYSAEEDHEDLQQAGIKAQMINPLHDQSNFQ